MAGSGGQGIPCVKEADLRAGPGEQKAYAQLKIQENLNEKLFGTRKKKKENMK